MSYSNYDSEDTQFISPEKKDRSEDTQVFESSHGNNDDSLDTRYFEMSDEPRQPHKKSNKKTLQLGGIILGAAAVLGLVGYGVYALISGGNPNSNPDHSDDAQFDNFGTLFGDIVAQATVSSSDYYEDEYDNGFSDALQEYEPEPDSDYYDYEEAVEVEAPADAYYYK